MARVELNDEEWNGVLWALQEAAMPMKVSYPLLLKIGEQLKRQGFSGVFVAAQPAAKDAKRQ